jgi:DNA-binding NtrC family response regulator
MTLPISPAPGGDRAGRLRLEAPRVSSAGLSALPVLVVDDEEDMRAEIAELLRRRGLTVLVAASAETALRLLAEHPAIGTLVTDIRLGGLDGLALAERALARRQAAEALEVVVITGYVSAGQQLAARRAGAFGMLLKPMRGADLAAMVADALAQAAARRKGGASPIRFGSAPPWRPLHPIAARQRIGR